MINNLDIGLELQKIRGGWMFNDINMHMNIKLDCLNNKHLSKCKWVNGLKYYVYSAGIRYDSLDAISSLICKDEGTETCVISAPV
ncbi:hypothetical protein ANCDUO_02965 [Ancylostoma duodenale]|uniref:Uncharacterized protein n=1 Tax=Ancylostoma duodenale TaxID=51022 RepID=A0A0C2H579_9BILA|nr:hypothetical protein ANCDUO_02965 [Ancylostoma duodenale]